MPSSNGSPANTPIVPPHPGVPGPAGSLRDLAQELAQDGSLERSDVDALLDKLLEDGHLSAAKRNELDQLGLEFAAQLYRGGAGLRFDAWSSGAVCDDELALEIRQLERQHGTLDDPQIETLIASARRLSPVAPQKWATLRALLFGAAEISQTAKRLLKDTPGIIHPYERGDLVFRAGDYVPPSDIIKTSEALFRNQPVVETGWTSREFDWDGDGVANRRIARRFDEAGRVVRLELDLAAHGQIDQVHQFFYDDLGRPLRVIMHTGSDPTTSEQATELAYYHDATGRIERETRQEVLFPNDRARRVLKQAETATRVLDPTTGLIQVTVSGEGRLPTLLPDQDPANLTCLPKGQILEETWTFAIDGGLRARSLTTESTDAGSPEMDFWLAWPNPLSAAREAATAGPLIDYAAKLMTDGTLSAEDCDSLVDEALARGLWTPDGRAQLETIVARHRLRGEAFIAALRLYLFTRIEDAGLASLARVLSKHGPVDERGAQELIAAVRGPSGVSDAGRAALRAIRTGAVRLCDRARRKLLASNLLGLDSRRDLVFPIPALELAPGSVVHYRTDGQPADIVDAQGRMLLACEYDAAARLIAAVLFDGAVRHEYEYDTDGNLTKEVQRKGDQLRTALHSREGDDERIEVTSTKGERQRIELDEASRPIRQCQLDAAGEIVFCIVQDFDGLDRVLRYQETSRSDDGWRSRTTQTLEYDGRTGNLIRATLVEDQFEEISEASASRPLVKTDIVGTFDADSGRLRERKSLRRMQVLLTQLSRATHTGDLTNPERIRPEYRQLERFFYAPDGTISRIRQITTETYDR